MIRRKPISFLSAALAAVMLLSLAACGAGTPASAPAEEAAPAPSAEPVITPEPVTRPERQPGERFEMRIVIEGMDETVRYEHIRNDALGFEMDYDYERFERHGGADSERFISVWDDPEDPVNFLEVTRFAEDAEPVAAAVKEELSGTYELTESTRELEGAGECLYIEASVLKGTNSMADELQAVYIIPASEGCFVASAHCAVEAAEGILRRFQYMLNTFSAIQG